MISMHRPKGFRVPRARGGVLAVVLAVASLASGVGGGQPAGAASVPNPCKVLKSAEIEAAFGVAPSPPSRAAREISSTSCSWTVTNSPDFGTGDVIVTVTFANAKPSYQGLARDARFTTLTKSADGIDGIYAPNPLSTVNALKGSKMLGVQGVFIDTSVRPVVEVEVKDPLVELARAGVKRI